jgi:hypothetical protein
MNDGRRFPSRRLIWLAAASQVVGSHHVEPYVEARPQDPHPSALYAAPRSAALADDAARPVAGDDVGPSSHPVGVPCAHARSSSLAAHWTCAGRDTC